MRYGDKTGERAVRANVGHLRAATLPTAAPAALHLAAVAPVVRRAALLPAAAPVVLRAAALQVLRREGQG